MDWIHDFQLFLFDFDGLLVKSEELHYQAYIDMCARRGFKLQWSFPEFCSYAHYSASGLSQGIYQAFPKLQEQEPSWNVLYEEKKRAYMELLSHKVVEMMPGAEELLRELEKHDIARCVVTNSLKEQIDLIRANQKALQSIPHWITRENYTEPKPHPECYLQAIQKYGKKGDRVVGFEDSIKGLKALLGTPAQPVLICSKDHPQIASVLDSRVLHFESLSEISSEVLSERSTRDS